MANAQMTNKDKLNMWKDRCSIMCSCGEDIVSYYCNDLECPNNKIDPLFCSPCGMGGDKHDHRKAPMIIDRINELDGDWNRFKETINRISTKAA